MGYKVTDNTGNVQNKIRISASIFLRNAAEEIDKIAHPNTPKRGGDLRDKILKEVLGLSGKIKWKMEYAAIQEVKQFRNYTTPGTGPRFARNAVEKAVANTQQIAKKSGLI